MENHVTFSGFVDTPPIDGEDGAIDFILSYGKTVIQVLCRKQKADVIAMQLKKRQRITVDGHIEGDGDLYIVADKVRRAE
jgi:hypothetical protein